MIYALESLPIADERFIEAFIAYEALDEAYHDADESGQIACDVAFLALCERFGENESEYAALAERIGACRAFDAFASQIDAAYAELRPAYLAMVAGGLGHARSCRDCRLVLEPEGRLEERRIKAAIAACTVGGRVPA